MQVGMPVATMSEVKTRMYEHAEKHQRLLRIIRSYVQRLPVAVGVGAPLFVIVVVAEVVVMMVPV